MTVSKREVRRLLTDAEIDACFARAAEIIREVRESLRVVVDKRPANLPRIR